MIKHWRAILGVLALIQPAWTFTKWALDWLGRLDLVASHLHDFGVQSMLDFIENPPPAALLPSIAIGLLLIWWDTKQKDAAKLDTNQKLLVGFYFSCAVVCAGVWFTAWFVSLPVKAALPPIMPATPIAAPKPPPPPPPPWVSQDEIERQRNNGRTLIVYSPEELLKMWSTGGNIGAYLNKWAKFDYTLDNLQFDKKDSKQVYIAVMKTKFGTAQTYFDPQKFEARLMQMRNGEDKIRALCQFLRIDRSKVNDYFYTDNLIADHCELL